MSRSKRWEEATQQASEALDELYELRDEAQEWFDNMPENLQGGLTGEKLQDIINIDLEGARDIVEECGGIEFPLGYGRD